VRKTIGNSLPFELLGRGLLRRRCACRGINAGVPRIGVYWQLKVRWNFEKRVFFWVWGGLKKSGKPMEEPTREPTKFSPGSEGVVQERGEGGCAPGSCCKPFRKKKVTGRARMFEPTWNIGGPRGKKKEGVYGGKKDVDNRG